MRLTVEPTETELILAEKHARDEFRKAKIRQASAEELEQKRDAWMKATQKRKELARNPTGNR